ncbi:metal ABC transporter substrate-binding protein [Patescibacteria group bacterium]
MRKYLAGTIFLIIGLAAIVILLVWPKTYQETDDSTVNVVATFLPVGLIAQEIFHDVANVELLADPLQDPHSYAYTPDDLKALERADLIITLGVGDLELWMNDALEIVDRNISQVALATELDLKRYADDHSHAHEDTGALSYDPHVWLDPVNSQLMATKLRDAAIVFYPDQAENIETNFTNYSTKMIALESELSESLAEYAGASFVAPHSAFAYFAQRFGLEEIGSVYLSPERTPTPEEVANLSRIIQENEITHIYTEPETDSDFIASLAKDLNLTIAVLDPLGTGKFEIGYYEKVMRANFQALIQGFPQ